MRDFTVCVTDIKKQVASIILVALSFGVAAPGSAGLTVATFETEKYNEAIKMYVYGVGSGYSWANAELITSKKPPLYCQPHRLPMGRDIYFDILVRYLDDWKKASVSAESSNKLGELEIEPLLLLALQRTFPCTK